MLQGTSLTYYGELLFNRLDIIENFLDRWFHWKKRLRVTPYTNCSLELKTCIPMPRLTAILTCLGLYAGRWIKIRHSLPMILILPILPVPTDPTFLNHRDSQNWGNNISLQCCTQAGYHKRCQEETSVSGLLPWPHALLLSSQLPKTSLRVSEVSLSLSWGDWNENGNSYPGREKRIKISIKSLSKAAKYL